MKIKTSFYIENIMVIYEIYTIQHCILPWWTILTILTMMQSILLYESLTYTIQYPQNTPLDFPLDFYLIIYISQYFYSSNPTEVFIPWDIFRALPMLFSLHLVGACFNITSAITYTLKDSYNDYLFLLGIYSFLQSPSQNILP